jgi:hypothetical protein
MNTSKLVALAACLSFSLPLTACAGNIATPDGSPAPTGTSPSPSSATTADWSCTAGGSSLPTWNHPASLDSDAVLAVHLVETYSHAGVGGVTVRACDASDTACAAPLATAQADDSGVVAMFLNGAQPSFDGYLEITGAQMPTNLVFFDGRAPALDGFYEVVVTTADALGISEVLAGVKLDPQRGVVRIEAHDCSGAPAAGVRLGVSTWDAQTTTAYSTGDGASLSAGAGATDPTGIALAFGVPVAGFGVNEAVGQKGVGGTIAFARAGSVSSVVAMP